MDNPKFDVDTYISTHNPDDKSIFWVAAVFLIVFPVAVYFATGFGCK